MGDRLGIHGAVDILILLVDCHQSCRKLAKAGADCSSALPLGEVELAEIECLSLDTEARMSQSWPVQAGWQHFWISFCHQVTVGGEQDAPGPSQGGFEFIWA